MMRFISLTILSVGLSLIVIGIIGGGLDPIEKSYLIEFKPRTPSNFTRVVSLNSGELHISIISDGNAKIIISKQVFNMGYEEVYRGFVSGYESIELSTLIPTNYYIKVELLPYGGEENKDDSVPKFLMGIIVYPNSNYGFVFGSFFALFGLVMYKIDWIKVLLRKVSIS